MSECPECHRRVGHKLDCSRRPDKQARVTATQTEGGAMSEVEVRPLLTRAQVEAARIHAVRFAESGCRDQVRALCDAYLALAAQLAAVDAFAREKDAPKTPKSDWSIGYDSGRDALRRELRAVRGIGAP